MKKITLFITALLVGQLFANAQTSCNDWNGYPQSKEIGSPGFFTLTKGVEEKAAQTYHYNGPGKITHLRIYGSTPNSWINLVAKIYNVDANGRPTTVVGSQNFSWMWWDNFTGYEDVVMPGSGITVNSNFAVSVEIVGGISYVTKFRVQYTGNGEGKEEDLASLAGTSTGFNWTSAKDNFSKDGDFYIIPRMKNYITPGFSVNTTCVESGGTVNFTNTTEMTRDSMFNKIGMSHYSGSEYFYTWNFGDGSPVSHVEHLSHVYAVASVHTVTLTATIDGWNGSCSATFTKQISVGLTASVASTANVTCNGGSDGNIVALASHGGSPYSYSLNGFSYQPSATFPGLTAGGYNIYIKDALGCIKTTTVSITQPAPIIFSPSSTTNSSCGTSDGALLVSATGGVQYSLNGSTWQASGLFNNLSAAGYTVWVKDAAGCTNTTNVLINDLGGPSLTLNSFTHATCNNTSGGTIAVTGSGGSGTLQYSLDGINYQASGAFNNLLAGTYNVRVKDGVGCIGLKTVVISEPPLLVLTASPTNEVSCHGGNDGQITVTSAIGGTGTFAYSVNNLNYQSSNIFNGLTAGTYSVSVKDVAGCIAKTIIVVSQPTVVTPSKVVTNLSCNGSQDGTISASASGGTPGYLYSINGDNFYPTGDFSELSAGSYTVTIKDVNGCSAYIPAVLTEPASIAASITTGNSTCSNANGNILAAANGGSGSGYQYSINGTVWNSTGSFTGLVDSNYVVLVQDGANCTNVFQAFVSDANGPVIQTVNHTNVSCNTGDDGTIVVASVTGGTGLLSYSLDGSNFQTSTGFPSVSAGNHTIIVKDALGCSGSYTLDITQPAAITLSASVVHVTCNGAHSGNVAITAGGGSGTLAYSLDGISFQSNNVFNNLAAGNYTAYVRDAGGCMGYAEFGIIEPPAVLIQNVGILNVTCHGAGDGSMFITANGGTGTLSYSINGTTYQSSNLFSGLAGGTYNIFVKDGNGCIKTTSAVIYEPSIINVSSNIYNITCSGGNDGVIDITVTGGTPTYYYAWSNASHNEDNFNLTAGTYTVVISDENRCSLVKSFTITQPANPLVVNGAVTDATGSIAGNGAIDITMTGGTAPYVYSWSNGATTQDISGLNPGPYLVTITDVNGCITSGIFTVNAVTEVRYTQGNSSVIHVYPNPANDYMIVQGEVKIDRIEIANLLGEVIYTEEPNTEKVQLNTGNYAEGMYFIKLSMKGNVITRKIQIVR